ncbi:hypothetical protein DPX16_16522 [Anabarilius grahami]|uniref:Uncharacterized protein n=1 Tax=Anabarilius grahami TaxID=495550 RepID=A0A3N0XUY8_ANAGA|nr:hypothetical protein DPX16_16522 [Anabarilius grahami]
MAENRDLLDLLSCSDYLLRHTTFRREDGDLRSQVQFLQDEVAVLQRCLRDLLDLQKSVIDCMSPDDSTVPVVSRPESCPLAASTPYVRGQALMGDSRLQNSPNVRSGGSPSRHTEQTMEMQSSDRQSNMSRTVVADPGASVRLRSGNFRRGKTFQRGIPPLRQ